MKDINITVARRRATPLDSPVIVCGNSIYTVCFTFDSEWDDLSTKTARFVYVKDGAVCHQDVVFEGDKVEVPVLSNIREVRVGVFAGDLTTTTPAVIPCEPSILCGAGDPTEPSEEVYLQIMALFEQKVLEFGTPVKNDFDPTSTYAQSGRAVADALEGVMYETPFKPIDLPLTETGHSYRLVDGVLEKVEEENCSPIVKCPKYLGFRIDDEETRLFLYIGTMEGDEFVPDENYHIDTTDTGAINHLRQAHNRFIETDGEKYFYYKINSGSQVTLMGCDEFPQGESDIIATVPNFVKGSKTDAEGKYFPPELKITGEKYYSVVLPSGCFYAVLNKKGMPTFLKPDTVDEEVTPVPTFNVSYQTGVDGNGKAEIYVNRGASFGVIPENIGAALLRLPCTYELSDLCIYTDKIVKSNAKSGRRRKAKELGEKIINFNFLAQNDIFWNDNARNMATGRRFYGVPYSSRWVNSHYLGFEVTPETVLNALNDPYSIAYDGGYYQIEEKDAEGNVIFQDVDYHTFSGYSEIAEKYDENGGIIGSGTGYGLVCSAFTSLITGNPYPQSNRGYTFDSNFVLENTVDMNSGEVLVKDELSHCVFVDEIYDKGYSLYEAVDPCVAKTTHTCPKDKTTYAAARVRNSTLDKYIYSVINKDISGYDKVKEDEPDNPNRLKRLLNFENIAIPGGSVRPWRGNKAVYGSWDLRGSSNDFNGSGIGVTLHNKVKAFNIVKPSGKTVPVTVKGEPYYLDILQYITDIESGTIEDGTYTLDAGDGRPEQFRFYNHKTVQLTFDAEGRAVFKNTDGTAAEDVEYIYIGVKGYGGAFGDDGSVGDMVIAKGKYYPDLALDTSRITDVRAAIISDISTDKDPSIESWGKYSCATSPDVVSEYKGGSLRVDIEKLKNSIGETTYNKDITDTLGVTQGTYQKNNGIFAPTAPNSQGSQLFEVKAGEKYFVTGCYGYAAALITAFDENKTYLPDKSVFSSGNANTSVDNYEYIVPEGVAYIGCSTRQTAAASPITGRDLVVKKEVTELDNAIAKSDVMTSGNFDAADEQITDDLVPSMALFYGALVALEERISALEEQLNSN